MPKPDTEKLVDELKKPGEDKKTDQSKKPGDKDKKTDQTKKPVGKGKKADQGKPVDETKPVDEGKVVEEFKKKKKKVLKVPKGIAHINATFNNTIITITDPQGNVIVSASAGSVGFKGTKKSTPFAASRAADNAGKKASSMGMQEISVYLKGPGAGREAAIRSLESAGLSIVFIRDVTPIPHDGCRAPKKRRV